MENLVCLRETVSSPPRMVPLSCVIILPIFIIVLHFFSSCLKQFYYSRCLSNKAVTEFEKAIHFLTPGLLYVCTEYRVIIVLALLRLTLLLKVQQHHSVPSSILLPPWEGKQWIRQGFLLRIIWRLEPSSTEIGNEAAFFHTRRLPSSLQGQSDSL